EPVQDDGIGVIGRHGCNSTVAMARCPVIVRLRLLGRMMAAIVIAATLTPVTAAADWPTYHYDAARTGNQPGQGLIRSQTSLFKVRVDGEVFAEPLVAGNRVLIATENNSIYSLDANTGAVQWGAHLGAPVPQNQLPCGNIDPVGITGTPVIDTAAGVVYVIGLVWAPGTSAPPRYQLFALNLNNGGRVLWQRPIDVANLGGSPAFDALVQGQRGALALNGGEIYIPFGGRSGDCGNYRGWVVAAPAAGFGSLITY